MAIVRKYPAQASATGSTYEVLDVAVNRAVADVAKIVVQRVEQLFAREHPLRI